MRNKIAFISAIILLSYNILFVASAATNSNAERGTPSNAVSRNIIELTPEEDVICKVSFPANVHACLDPGNILGKGQVFSDSYIIENYGNTDIAVKIKNIEINYPENGEIYEFSEEATASNANAKKINIKMVWKNEAEKTERILHIEDGNPDKFVLFLKASKYNRRNEYVSLNTSSKGLFYFTGILDSNIDWEDSGLSVKFDYEIETEESDDESSDSINFKDQVEKDYYVELEDKIENDTQSIEETINREENEIEKNQKTEVDKIVIKREEEQEIYYDREK